MALNTQTSIVDYLKSQKKDSSFGARQTLASQYGIQNYTGSAQQNTQLLGLVQGGGSTTSTPAVNTTPGVATTATAPSVATGAPRVNVTDPGLQQIQNIQDAQYNAETGLLNEVSDIQKESINNQTEFNIGRIEQAKQGALEEQRGQTIAAQTQYEQAINPYGVQAEQIAGQGLNSGGFAESVQAQMFNTYQTRLTNVSNQVSLINQEYTNMINQAYLSADTQMADLALTVAKGKIDALMSQFSGRASLVEAQMEQDRWLKEFNASKSGSQPSVYEDTDNGGQNDFNVNQIDMADLYMPSVREVFTNYSPSIQGIRSLYNEGKIDFYDVGGKIGIIKK